MATVPSKGEVVGRTPGSGVQGTAAPTPLRSLAAVTVGVSAALALVGLAIGLFFNPAWVAFEQDRTRADLWTGYTPAQVHAVTNDVLREVYLGPGTFLQAVDGSPVFNAAERGHMADVRGVMVIFLALVALAGIVLLVSGLRARGAWWWRAVARGAAVLGVGTVVVGAAFGLFFEQAFTLFHELFFPGGNWSFDPRTDRLVQLFPDAFWTETTVAIAAVGVVLTAVTWWFARRRARVDEGEAGPAGAAAPQAAR